MAIHKFYNSVDRRAIYAEPFMEDGYIMNYNNLENFLDLAIQRAILDPIHINKIKELESVDLETINPKMQTTSEVSSNLINSDIALNLTFTEPSISDFDIIKNNRAIISEICFEKLKVHSISFQKSASLHLFSDLKMNGIVVDMGAQYT